MKAWKVTGTRTCLQCFVGRIDEIFIAGDSLENLHEIQTDAINWYKNQEELQNEYGTGCTGAVE